MTKSPKNLPMHNPKAPVLHPAPRSVPRMPKKPAMALSPRKTPMQVPPVALPMTPLYPPATFPLKKPLMPAKPTR